MYKDIVSQSTKPLRFYRIGGGNRIAGFLLAVATAILLIIGPWPIAYIRKFPSFNQRVILNKRTL